MAQFKGIRKLSQKQYNKLKKAGTLDAGIVYVTPDKSLKLSTGEIAPTAETIGDLGQFYLDTVAKKLYQCVNVTTDESAGTTTYEWQAVGGGSGKYAHFISLTTSRYSYIAFTIITEDSLSYHNIADISLAVKNTYGSDNNICASGYLRLSDIKYNNTMGNVTCVAYSSTNSDLMVSYTYRSHTEIYIDNVKHYISTGSEPYNNYTWSRLSSFTYFGFNDVVIEL